MNNFYNGKKKIKIKEDKNKKIKTKILDGGILRSKKKRKSNI
jgi:hypothetical protein